VHEVERKAAHSLNAPELYVTAREAVARVHNLRLGELLLVLPGAIPKTSSGKVRRGACRQAYLQGTLRSSGLHGSRRLLIADGG
jgi:acyl-CoA synthetase (AMP-forming)/AMP-acid ligase II